MHAEELQRRHWKLVIERGVDIEINKEELENIRSYMRNELHSPLPEDESDKVAYMKYVCLCTPQEIEQLFNIVLRGSMPTQEAIQEAVASFRNDI